VGHPPAAACVDRLRVRLRLRWRSEVTALDSAAEAEFKTIVEALTGFCVQNLSLPDRAKLADKLRDPSLTFASPVAAEAVPEIVSRLLE
jgi:hypothetical protein